MKLRYFMQQIIDAKSSLLFRAADNHVQNFRTKHE